jgi:hypothetical protein
LSSPIILLYTFSSSSTTLSLSAGRFGHYLINARLAMIGQSIDYLRYHDGLFQILLHLDFVYILLQVVFKNYCLLSHCHGYSQRRFFSAISVLRLSSASLLLLLIRMPSTAILGILTCPLFSSSYG